MFKQRLASRSSASSAAAIVVEKKSFPVIASASERIEEQHKRIGSYIENLIGSSTDFQQPAGDTKVNFIKLKTKLNASHEWKFKIPRSDPISKVPY
jgi:hypothetical protein